MQDKAQAGDLPHEQVTERQLVLLPRVLAEVRMRWLNLIQVTGLNTEHSLPYDRGLMKPSKLWLINDFKTLWSCPLQISTELFSGIGVWLMLLRRYSRQTVFSLAHVKASLFQRFFFVSRGPDLTRCQEDRSLVKRPQCCHSPFVFETWCLQASWAAPARQVMGRGFFSRNCWELWMVLPLQRRDIIAVEIKTEREGSSATLIPWQPQGAKYT